MTTHPHPQGPFRSHQAEPEAPASAEAITPELALVTPDLANLARRALPERPWERAPVGPAPSRQPERRCAAPDRRAARFSSSSTGRPRLRVFPLVGLVLAAGVALVMFVRSPEDEVARPPAQAARPQVAPASGQVAQPASGQVAQPASAGPSSPAPAPLLPHGGYLAAPSGSLVADKAGRTIERFELPVRCGGRPLVVEDVPVKARSFRLVTTGPRAVRVQGRVVSPTRIRGVVTHRGGTCAPRRVVFTARLS